MYTKKIEEMKYEIIFESEDELERFNNFVNPKATLKAAEVMKILGITRVTLCHYVKQGKIKVDLDYSGKQYRYLAESVYNLLNNKERN